LVCGSAGCGKTLLAVEFLVRGATEFGENGVFMAFEESAEELSANVRSLGFDLDALSKKKKLAIEQIRIDKSEFEENGEYDLEGLFIRLRYAIDSVGAKRVVLDTLETLFGGLSNEMILRSELQRLFRWFKEQGLTAVITAERGEGALTRQGLEEYVSDCVILLDQRVIDQVSTRRLRIVKYRGTSHGTNEYPFLIDEDGFSVLPITTQALDHPASDQRVSTGVPDLDAMLRGGGPYRGSSVLISGTAGTGKSSISAHFADASCRRGERCLYFAFEESVNQITRNMRSIGIDLAPWTKKGLLRFVPGRPTLTGLEMHLAVMHKLVRDFEPRLVIVDPISNLSEAGTTRDATAMLSRLLDFLKAQGITTLFTALTSGGGVLEGTDLSVSSLIDTWLLLRDIELGGERNRGMYVLKSRGMRHSNQIREFLLTDSGIELREVYSGPEGILTGSMRVAQEAREREAEQQRLDEYAGRRRAFERKKREIEARMAALRAELEEESAALESAASTEAGRVEKAAVERNVMTKSRQGEVSQRMRRGNGKPGARA
jgi:circadian clock protein KaiC